MESLFNNATYETITSRILKLSENDMPLWGKMSVGQMLKHCQGPLDVALQNISLNTNIGRFRKLMLKLYKPLLYNDTPWKKSIPTSKEFIVDYPVDFKTEQDTLLQLIKDFKQLDNEVRLPVHPLFGTFTKAQWGQMEYKHLDHHLKQFGV
ncbi:DUF1569 domain-containing protein [Formosa sp. S-31]|uniref:DUF1569 domain-containing protein n=1 Tax=Formosa sp. S-31 TaxID=2790949 RepID=UPI003EBACAFE